MHFIFGKIHFIITNSRFIFRKVHFIITRIYFIITKIHFIIRHIHFTMTKIHFTITKIHFVITKISLYNDKDSLDDIQDLHRQRHTHDAKICLIFLSKSCFCSFLESWATTTNQNIGHDFAVFPNTHYCDLCSCLSPIGIIFLLKLFPWKG